MKKVYRFLLTSLKSKLTLLFAFVFISSFSSFSQNPCPSASSSNLITNGNFESCVIGNQANDGFTNDYTYTGTTTCPGGEGTSSIGDWSVTTSANTLNGAYANPTGTPGTGNPTPNHYLLVDVDGDTTNKATYTTTVNVVTGTTYFFSAWMADINTNYTNPPILKFTINGAQIGKLVYVDSLANSHAWQQFFVTWKATTTGTITIEIQNKQPTSDGNDLALDNISFTTGCSSISNLNALGKTANIIDTLYECDLAFPYTITSGLPSNYGFTWKNSSYTALSGTNNQSSYTFTTAPATGKYYLCYDTIPGCYRADSFIVSNKLSVSLGANLSLCPPINQTLTAIPSLTAPGLTYSWKLNGSTIIGATSSSYQATQIGTYQLTVNSTSCGSFPTSVTITSPSSPLAGTVSCTGGAYQFTANSGTFNVINGDSNVVWYNVPSAGSAFASNPNHISARVVATSLAPSPGCTTGGLYLQDLNSFDGTLGPTTQPCTSVSTMGNTAGYMELTVYANVTISSIQIIQQNYSTGGTATYAAQILSNSPGSGPYSGTCNCNTNGPGAVIAAATGPTYTFPQVSSSSPAIRTLNFGPSGAGYTLTGSPTGTIYWIGISGSEFGYLTCSATYPYENVPANASVIELTEQLIYNGVSTDMMGFNIQFSVGTPNPCNRSWVCENASCVTPVKFLYVNVESENNGTTINWATASEINNKYFVVQKSSDDIHFTNIDTVAGAGNSSTVRTYNYTDKQANDGITYYRIVQVDYNGDYTYSEVRVAENTSSNYGIVSIYPQPLGKPEKLTINYLLSQKSEVVVQIIDALGKGIYSGMLALDKGGNLFSIDAANYPPGIYCLIISSQDVTQSRKIVIE